MCVTFLTYTKQMLFISKKALAKSNCFMVLHIFEIDLDLVLIRMSALCKVSITLICQRLLLLCLS